MSTPFLGFSQILGVNIMNSVERVKQICKQRKIPISKLERDLGYSNAYIAQLRKGVFPAERLHEIANYLEVSPEYLLYGDTPETKNEPAAHEGDELTDTEARVISLLRQIPADRQDEAYTAIESLLRLMLR